MNYSRLKRIFKNKIIITTLAGVSFTLTGCLKNIETDSNNNSDIDTNSSSSNGLVSIEDNYNTYSNEKTLDNSIIDITPNKESTPNNVSDSSESHISDKDSEINEFEKYNLDYDKINNIFVSFNNIDTKKSLEKIKDKKITFYFRDLIEPDKAINKYNLMKEYDSSHDLEFISDKKINKSLLKNKVIKNTEEYFNSNPKAYHSKLSDSDFNKIFDYLVESLNNSINDEIDIYELDDNLKDLKIVNLTSNSNGVFETYNNVLGINVELINYLNKNNILEMICSHEAKHIIQSGSILEKDNELYNKNIGILYEWDDLEYNSLNYQWFVEGSAEKLMLLDMDGINDSDVYKYMVSTIDSIYLSSIYNEEVNEYTLPNISLQSNLNKLFDYFNCEDDKDKEEIIMFMNMYEIINNNSNTFFREAFKNKYNEPFSENYKDNLKCQCAEVLSKNFYYNAIKRLSNSEDSLNNIFYVMNIFESDISGIAKTEYIRTDDQKIFMETYEYNKNIFFECLSEATNISIDELYNMYNNYDINNSELDSNLFNEQTIDFINRKNNSISNDYKIYNNVK